MKNFYTKNILGFTHTPKILVYGFTFMETIIALGLLLLMLAIVLPNIKNSRGRDNLNSTSSQIISVIEKAQNQTLNSLDALQYSVRVEATRVVLFSGTNFTEGAVGNEILLYENGVQATWSLNGGGQTLSFARLTGDTNNYGTITISLTTLPSTNKIITVLKTGSVSVN